MVSFFTHLHKNTWFGHFDALCHITDDDEGLYDVTNINSLVQGSLGSMSAHKKGKHCVKVRQVDGKEKANIVASDVLYKGRCESFLICELSQKKYPVMKKVLKTAHGNVFFNCQIKI